MVASRFVLTISSALQSPPAFLRFRELVPLLHHKLDNFATFTLIVSWHDNNNLITFCSTNPRQTNSGISLVAFSTMVAIWLNRASCLQQSQSR